MRDRLRRDVAQLATRVTDEQLLEILEGTISHVLESRFPKRCLRPTLHGASRWERDFPSMLRWTRGTPALEPPDATSRHGAMLAAACRRLPG